MFRSVPMTKILICALERDADRLTEVLGRREVLHLTRAVQEEGTVGIEPVMIDDNLERTRTLLNSLRDLAARLHIDLTPGGTAAAGTLPSMSTEDMLKGIETFIERTRKENAALLAEQDRLADEKQRATDIIEEIEPYAGMRIPIEDVDRFSFLHFAVGTLSEAKVKALSERLAGTAVVVPLGSTPGAEEPFRTIAAISDKKGRWAVETALKELDFKPSTLPERITGLPADVHRGALKRRAEIEHQEQRVLARIREVAAACAEPIARHYETLLVTEQILQAKANFGRTTSTVVLSGWVPSRLADEVTRTVLEATSNRAIIELHSASELLAKGEDVPVLLQNPAWLKPFESLVKAYGFPSYTEIEPTLFAAVSFLVMFGLMFGDLGHGLMLLAVGVVMWRTAKEEGARNFGYIVGAAGLSAALFGLFFQGSAFGLSLAEAGWPLTLDMEPLGRGGANVMLYLALTVGLGIVIITVGLLLNIWNRLRSKDYEHGIMDRFGLAGFIFYWGALGLGMKWTVLGTHHYDAVLIVLLIVLPLVMICFREPVFGLINRRHKVWEEGVGMGLVTGFLEVYETVSAYLANTMSFARVGAFALSHAGLCFTIYEFERMARGVPGGPVWAILVLILGHLFVVALEGFVVFIQILRLEYYEFFGKFFRAEGHAYSPLRVGKRAEDTPK